MTVGLALGATSLLLSTGTSFTPGPRMVDGADLNVMLNALNTVRSQIDGTNSLPSSVANAVNFIQLNGAATGSNPSITVGGASKDAGAIVRLGGAVATCTATAATGNCTANGQQVVATISSITTAASTLAATFTINNSSAVSTSNNALCQVLNYAGTGVPIIGTTVMGTGSIAVKVQNVSTGAALNASVAVYCAILS